MPRCDVPDTAGAGRSGPPCAGKPALELPARRATLSQVAPSQRARHAPAARTARVMTARPSAGPWQRTGSGARPGARQAGAARVVGMGRFELPLSCSQGRRDRPGFTTSRRCWRSSGAPLLAHRLRAWRGPSIRRPSVSPVSEAGGAGGCGQVGVAFRARWRGDARCKVAGAAVAAGCDRPAPTGRRRVRCMPLLAKIKIKSRLSDLNR